MRDRPVMYRRRAIDARRRAGVTARVANKITLTWKHNTRMCMASRSPFYVRCARPGSLFHIRYGRKYR